MIRRISRIAFGLAAAMPVALPMAADELKDAIECEQYLVMAESQVPAGSDAAAQVKALKQAWGTHIRLATGDADSLAADRASAGQAIYHVFYTGDAAAKQAFMGSMQRCITPPAIETAVYPDLTCASFAQYAETAATDTIAQQEGKALLFTEEGEPEKAAIAQGYVDASRRRLKLAARIRHAFYTAQPTTRVTPNHFGLFGDAGEPLLNSCIASMRLEG